METRSNWTIWLRSIASAPTTLPNDLQLLWSSICQLAVIAGLVLE